MTQYRHGRPAAVRVDAKGVRVRSVADAGIAEVRRQFGGLDLPAGPAGMLCAPGLTVLLAGLAGGAGSIAYQRGHRWDSDSLSPEQSRSAQ